jgi:uncharacterized membrane protein YeaQ/YmgE (transglycosylase-associated protein family)
MGLISWIIFGALAGWVASLIVGNSSRQGCLMNIVVGIVGAFIGGMIANLLFGGPIAWDWSWRSFGIAVLGAVLLLSIFSRRR